MLIVSSSNLDVFKNISNHYAKFVETINKVIYDYNNIIKMTTMNKDVYGNCFMHIPNMRHNFKQYIKYSKLLCSETSKTTNNVDCNQIHTLCKLIIDKSKDIIFSIRSITSMLNGENADETNMSYCTRQDKALVKEFYSSLEYIVYEQSRNFTYNIMNNI